MIASEALRAYRARQFGLTPGTRVSTLEQAVAFINQRGIVFFYPEKIVPMPSLWVAVAGDRPVPDEHDDPGHITWTWKDDSLGKHYWYYGRALRKRNLFIALDLLPTFYALSPNYGDYREDYLIDYEQGLVTQDARQMYEALLREGPLDTIALRKAARLQGSQAAYTHALNELQVSFRILPTGITQAGAWHYSFLWDILARHLPEIPDQAHSITEFDARRTLVMTYLHSVGATTEKDLLRLFGWPVPQMQRTLGSLTERGDLLGGEAVEGETKPYYGIPAVLNGYHDDFSKA